MSLRFRIVLSLACAALSLLAFWSYGSHVREEADQVRQEALERYGGEVVGLVVANRGIAAGEQLGISDVSEVDWLVDLAPEGSIGSLEDVLGATVTVPVAKGAPLTELNLREESVGMEVPEGRVALSIPVTDRTGVPREAHAGSVLAAYAIGDIDVRLVSADLVVLSVPGVARGESVLSVAAWPEEVTSVLLASARGELRLVLPAEGLPPLDGSAPAEVGEPEGDEGAQDVQEEQGGGPSAGHAPEGDGEKREAA